MMLRLVQQAYRLQPPEDLFRPLPFLLADSIIRLTYPPAMGGAGAPGRVLGKLRDDPQRRSSQANSRMPLSSSAPRVTRCHPDIASAIARATSHSTMPVAGAVPHLLGMKVR
jgi:hypothetical protein